jgi:hypothetical protein
MNQESSLSAFLLTALYCIYLDIIVAYHLFPALAEYQPQVYSSLLFSPATQTCYVLHRLPSLWSYGVFRCFISLRVIIVFRDTIYVIIILYS